MGVQGTPFFSDRYLLDADLHTPDDDGAAAPYPVVVACSGYEGLKTIHPERFARALTPLGFAVLAFDYRGFGLSEGERGRLVPQEWAEDVRAGVGMLSTCPQIDSERISLLGWGLGGGVVVAATVDDPMVRSVTVVNGIADGARSIRSMHDEHSWDDLIERIRQDRGHRACHGRSMTISPWDLVRLGNDTPVSSYVGQELYRAHGFGSWITLESADYVLRFSPERVVDALAPTPLLIVHGAENLLHLPHEAHVLYQQAGEPKRLELLNGAGHTEWMYDYHPTFHYLVEMVADFVTKSATDQTAGRAT